MNFLALVNMARREGGSTGGPLSTLAGTQNDEVSNYIAWVANSWNDLQRMYNQAKFMRSEFVLALSNGQWKYATTDVGFTLDPLGGLKNFKLDSLRAATDTAGFTDEQPLPFMDYDRWKLLYRFGNMRLTTAARPTLFSVHPDRSLVLGPVPLGGCAINGEYYRMPQQLAVDADVPNLPSDFHELIAWRALRLYGSFDAATEVFQRATTEIQRIQSDLEADQMEPVYIGQPLA